MRKFILFSFTLLFFTSGCSSRDWKAMLTLSKAEDLTHKAYEMRVSPAKEKQRQELYSQACAEFHQAFLLAPKLFTLNRFNMALDDCTRAERDDILAILEPAAAKYEAAHPMEAEQGDAFVGLE